VLLELAKIRSKFVVGAASNMYRQFYLLCNALLTSWELYLDQRQLKKNREDNPPEEIKDLVPMDRFTKSQKYQVDKVQFSMASKLINLASGMIEVVFLWPLMWSLSKQLVGENEYARSIAWAIMSSFVSYPVSIPLELYSTFVLEAKHGFNKMTIKLFVTDKIKNALLSVVFTVILVPMVIYVVHWGGENFYWYMWMVAQALIFIFMFIYPTLIMPLFNKYEALHDQELKKHIEELASGLKFPLTKLFQVDGSKRSGHSNAYMFGFWKNKRIVLYDTLLQTQVSLEKESEQELGFEFEVDGSRLKVHSLKNGNSSAGKWNEVHKGRNDELRDGDLIVAIGSEKDPEKMTELLRSDKSTSEPLLCVLDRKPYTTDEILAVLCHEIGHWFHAHVLRMLVISSVHIFLVFRMYGFVMYSAPLFQSFGFAPEERSIMIGLSIFMLMFTPVETAFGMCMIVLTRMHEYQADDFAVKQNRSLQLGTGLRKLCIENLGDLNPDPLYAWFHHSHPSLVERLRNMREKAESHDKKSQ